MIYLKPCGKHYGFNGDKCSLCSVSRPVDGVLTTDVCQINNSHGKKKVISKKPECDHIVALREVMSVICLPLSKLKELSDLHKRDGTWKEIFYWLGEEECTSRECPLCCEKLDWEAIEKQLNS